MLFVHRMQFPQILNLNDLIDECDENPTGKDGMPSVVNDKPAENHVDGVEGLLSLMTNIVGLLCL